MLTGFFSSGLILPRMKRVISTGVSVTASKDEKSMAKVFV